jgi:hypothetical protein
MKWTCTEDGFPENKQRVLMAGEWSGAPKVVICTFLERYITEIVDWRNVFVGDDKGLFCHTKMYWMPLPKSPFEKESQLNKTTT